METVLMASFVDNSGCKVCRSPVEIFGRTTVRSKYEACFLKCQRCGFVFAENPHWLAEAYSEPINLSDTGYISRNLTYKNRVQMFIELFLNPNGKFLDHGAGYGVFVRLMRDMGY